MKLACYTQNMGERSTSFGCLEYIKVRHIDGRPLSWREVWDAFSDSYPDRWAVEFLPPASELVDEANIYHLFILPTAPTGVNINRRSA